MGEAVDFHEIAEKPACQIDQVDALIDQLPAAGALGLRAPFAVVAEPSAVPVAGADEQQRPENAGVDQAPRLLECPVIAMTESDPDPNAVACGELRQVQQLIRMACAGLFEQHMHAGGNRRARDFRMRIGRSRDDHRVDIGADPTIRASHCRNDSPDSQTQAPLRWRDRCRRNESTARRPDCPPASYRPRRNR